MKYWQTALAILAALTASLALAEDFKTVSGKEYKDATVSRVESDGIVLRTRSGIAKLYFAELPKQVQERFGYNREAPQQVAPKAVVDRSAARSQHAANRPDCLDFATAKAAEDSAAASLDAAVKAAKNGDSATAASHMQSAAAHLRTAADAVSADAAISQPITKAAEAYDKAAVGYARGDEFGASLYATAAIEFVKSSTDALQKSSVPRCP